MFMFVEHDVNHHIIFRTISSLFHPGLQSSSSPSYELIIIITMKIDKNEEEEISHAHLIVAAANAVASESDEKRPPVNDAINSQQHSERKKLNWAEQHKFMFCMLVSNKSFSHDFFFFFISLPFLCHRCSYHYFFYASAMYIFQSVVFSV